MRGRSGHASEKASVSRFRSNRIVPSSKGFQASCGSHELVLTLQCLFSAAKLTTDLRPRARGGLCISARAGFLSVLF